MLTALSANHMGHCTWMLNCNLGCSGVTFLFWMVHCDIWDRCIVGVVNLVFCNCTTDIHLSVSTFYTLFYIVTVVVLCCYWHPLNIHVLPCFILLLTPPPQYPHFTLFYAVTDIPPQYPHFALFYTVTNIHLVNILVLYYYSSCCYFISLPYGLYITWFTGLLIGDDNVSDINPQHRAGCTSCAWVTRKAIKYSSISWLFCKW